MTRVYIAGPMTGIPEFNFPAFNRAAAAWRRHGYEVINPAENEGGDTSLPYDHYMRQDIQHVLNVDAIAVLPGWESSKGASLEVHIATVLGLKVYDAELGPLAGAREVQTESAAQEAHRLVHGSRGADYGHPIEDFTRTGKMWGAILGTDPVPPDKVALCMVAVKVSREVNAPKRDNRVDIAGYAETLEMVRQRQGAA